MIAQPVNGPSLDPSDALQIAVWFLAIMLVAGGAMYALRRWRKWLQERLEAPGNEYNDIFSLEALDKLLADGQITQDEYRRLRRVRLGLSPEKQPPADSSSSPPAPDVDAQ